jgi:hypothetical protein
MLKKLESTDVCSGLAKNGEQIFEVVYLLNEVDHTTSPECSGVGPPLLHHLTRVQWCGATIVTLSRNNVLQGECKLKWKTWETLNTPHHFARSVQTAVIIHPCSVSTGTAVCSDLAK